MKAVRGPGTLRGVSTLHRELQELLDEALPPLVDLEQLERLVTEDELRIFDEECTIHPGCRPVYQPGLSA